MEPLENLVDFPRRRSVDSGAISKCGPSPEVRSIRPYSRFRPVGTSYVLTGK